MDAGKIKAGIECCIENDGDVCNVCPYFTPGEHSDACTGNLLADAMELIEQLEERISIMTEIRPVNGFCEDCKHYWEGYCGKGTGLKYVSGVALCEDKETRKGR